jgi:mRNA interferase RelE/StbE
VKSYQVRFLPEAAEELASLDKSIAERILKKLKWLAENFTNLTPEPLSGGLKGLFKLRVGSYRVLYSFG